MHRQKTVVVAMSGGVDSSVAAYILKEQGYRVIGVTMQIWQDEALQKQETEGGCCGLSAVEDARRVAQVLDIPHYVMNFKQEFQIHVIDYFIREYQTGHTPNPCIACNRYVKWDRLLQRSIEIGADYIATGHYAGVRQLNTGRYAVEKSVAADKDQSYVLYSLTQEQLARTLMPLGKYEKDRVREIAGKAGLPVARKPDSMELCFVPDGNYASFIEETSGVESKPGNFVDIRGKVLGRHRRIIHYTIGQRKGLNLALGYPAYVVRIIKETNEIVIGQLDDILSEKVYMSQVNFMSKPDFSENKIYLGKIRYNHKGSGCMVRQAGDGLYECVFSEPQRAVTPGQALVLYDGSLVAGGGTIL